jgi:anti-anti-sigma factor
MVESAGTASVQARCIGDVVIIYTSDYLNKLSGERVERECRLRLAEGCRALVLNFRDTELVNSIGISILMGVIDAAEESSAQLVFSDVNAQTTGLFEMLGLKRHVQIAKDENEALASLASPAVQNATNGEQII